MAISVSYAGFTYIPDSVRNAPHTGSKIGRKYHDESNLHYERSEAQCRSRWKKLILAYAAASNDHYNLWFLSISFPYGSSDDMCYNVMRKIIVYNRTIKWFDDFIWIAERQKNGTIHFHMIVHNLCNKKELNSRIGYFIEQEAGKANIVLPNFNKDNYNGCDWDNIVYRKSRGRIRRTNSKQENAMRVARYISKYISKSSENINRRRMGCSKSISKLQYKQVLYGDMERDFIYKIKHKLNEAIKVVNKYTTTWLVPYYIMCNLLTDLTHSNIKLIELLRCIT